MDYLKVYLVNDKENILNKIKNILNKIKNINNNFIKHEYYIYITDNGIIKKFNGILKYLILHEDSELYNKLQKNDNIILDTTYNTIGNEVYNLPSNIFEIKIIENIYYFDNDITFIVETEIMDEKEICKKYYFKIKNKDNLNENLINIYKIIE